MGVACISKFVRLLNDMPKMRYRTKDGEEFEFDGEELEIRRLLQMVREMFTQPPTQASETVATKEEPTIEMPGDAEIEAYIKSKPRYEHNMVDIQRHFFGTFYSSRSPNKRIYHTMNKRIANIRKKIETEEKGKFKGQYIKGGLKCFTFERTPQTWLSK